MSSPTQPRVVIIRHTIKHYRVPFYQHLYEYLKNDGIELHVIYGNTNRMHRLRDDNTDLPREYGRRVKARWIGDSLVYHPAVREIQQADLAIIGHENKYLLNLLLLPMSAMGLKKIGYWDWDWYKNGAIKTDCVGGWLRHRTVNAVDWWFAYTKECAEGLRKAGVTCGITAVENAVDTSSIRNWCGQIAKNEISDRKSAMGMQGARIGIYCGSLHPAKRLDFLVEAVEKIRERLPNFHLLVIGTGEQRKWMEETAKAKPFVHYLGPLYGRESALAMRMSEVFMIPGMVGLAVLDAFAAGLPVLTTDHDYHGPEVDYLEPGTNGLISPNHLESYADAVAELLNSPHELARLRSGSLVAAQRYTVENMANNFRNGIRECLAMSRTLSQKNWTDPKVAHSC